MHNAVPFGTKRLCLSIPAQSVYACIYIYIYIYIYICICMYVYPCIRTHTQTYIHHSIMYAYDIHRHTHMRTYTKVNHKAIKNKNKNAQTSFFRAFSRARSSLVNFFLGVTVPPLSGAIIARMGAMSENPYIYVYVCMYVCIHVHPFRRHRPTTQRRHHSTYGRDLWESLNICMYVCMHVHGESLNEHACVCIYTYIHKYVCMYESSARPHAPCHKHMHACVQRKYTNTFFCILSICTYLSEYFFMCMHGMQVYSYLMLWVNTYIHTHMHACI